MTTGDTIFVPRNIQHAFIQLSEKGKMMVSYLPSGKMEAFFKLTNEWILPPTNEEINKAERIKKEYFDEKESKP